MYAGEKTKKCFLPKKIDSSQLAESKKKAGTKLKKERGLYTGTVLKKNADRFFPTNQKRNFLGVRMD